MTAYKKATKLTEVAAAVRQAPLESGDPRYVETSRSRGTDALELLRICLMDHGAARDHFAKITLTGHRGCGKSTELLRLEHEIRDRFTSLHVYADEALIGDYQYSDLFLWLVDELVKKFYDDGLPLNQGVVDDVASWFAEVTSETEVKVHSQIALDAGVELRAKYGIFGNSLQLLARLKSMVVGSADRRKMIRSKLQSYPLELIRKIDVLLGNARDVLRENGKPAELLIVVDNLDRLKRPVSLPLFFDNGELLKRPKAHFIYTVPIATVHAPESISAIFPNSYTLAMVKVRNKSGKVQTEAVNALLDVIDGRMETDRIFSSRRVARKLVEKSGGSLRDLMRLIDYAQAKARVGHQERIDNEFANKACEALRLDYEKNLFPRAVYFPLLAQIHQFKSDGFTRKMAVEGGEFSQYIERFLSLLNNGAILEFNGKDYWYDVHPVVQEIEAFKEALADGQSPPQPEDSPA